MFSVNVEEVFQITNRKGITLICTISSALSEIIRIGDYLVDVKNNNRYKVIGLEMLHFSNKEKELTHNPAIIIEEGNYEPSDLIGKVLETH